ncbi:pyruvate oxidase [Gracilibacillus caseinilyticus]|uniref:Pyruvate oxidase n=1 Tax=Gracilibacillus caseinilyticus TaxID=2932256 RepID=A0ABY4ETX9_9BACI|nr:pyruvate oxidase [Gracilibacillus caseinilyticus]UOQ47084.1 pyruvate oxidase [Gracilibacillus caseinilyticus]
MKASEAVIDIFKEWNIAHVYGYPGDSINHLIEALRTAKDEIKFIQVRQEEVGSLAASAEAKLTNHVGVCLSIGGPGAIHLLNRMYDAREDGAPLVVITGQVSHDLVGTENFQEVNLERMFDDVAIFNRRVTSPELVQPLLKQAFKEAYTQKGVAVLSIPDDVFSQTVKKDKLRSIVHSNYRLFPDKEDVKQAAMLLQQSRKPVILAGKGAIPAREELEKFAEKIAAPVVVSLRGKGVLPDEHPNNLGNLGQIGTKPAYEAMAETDLLILIGTAFPYREFLPDDVSAIQIDIDPSKIGKWYPVDVGLVGSSKEILARFNEQLFYAENRSFLEACQENMANWWKHLDGIVADKEALQGPQVIHQLQAFVEDDAILSVDVGNVTSWSARFFRMTNQQFVISSWLATMGCGLPGAISVKLTQPEKQVWAICGDGGFSMVMQDFLTAVKYQLPITVLVLNNEKIGMIKYEQELIGNIPYQTDIEPMNYAAFADICGGKGYSATTQDELQSALAASKEDQLPTIIDVEIEDRAPLPGKIEWNQAKGYSKHVWEKLVEREGELDMPSLKTVLKRLF